MTTLPKNRSRSHHRATAILLLLFSFLSGAVAGASEHHGDRVTGILGAFPEEIRVLKEAMGHRQASTALGIEFITGELEGRAVVLAYTGVGKVNAAMTTTLLLDHFHPTEVIFTGIAGGVNPALFPGDLVIGTLLAQHDLGAITETGFRPEGVSNPLNGRRNPVFFHSAPDLVDLSQRAARKTDFARIEGGGKTRRPTVVSGVIVTGDIFVASEEKASALGKDFGAEAVEMEGGAVAQVCFQHNVPFVVLRSISDHANNQATVDLQTFTKTAAMNSAALTRSMLKILAKRDAHTIPGVMK